jgi:hypothetical protein
VNGYALSVSGSDGWPDLIVQGDLVVFRFQRH